MLMSFSIILSNFTISELLLFSHMPKLSINRQQLSYYIINIYILLKMILKKKLKRGATLAMYLIHHLYFYKFRMNAL